MPRRADRTTGERVVANSQRSMQRIDEADLQRLVPLARDAIDDLFRRKPDARARAGNYLCLALCQGGALHYLDHKTGVKDFDVWAFFERSGPGQFPYRWRGEVDFGIAKFGRTAGFSEFVGRKVDVLGRSIPVRKGEQPPDSLLRYIRDGTAKTPRLLSEKAGVLLHPEKYFGRVLWHPVAP